MRVLMDRRAEFQYENSGMGTYAAMMWQHLRQSATNERQLRGWGEEARRRTDPFFWEHLMERSLRPRDCDLLFVPHNGIGDYDYSRLSCPAVVTVHDLIPYILPECTGAGYRELFFQQMPEILEKAAHLIAVSHQTKEDLCRFGGVAAENVTVIYEGVHPFFQPLPSEYVRYCLQKTYGLSQPYVLYVGGFSGRKNVETLLCAYGALYRRGLRRCPLVLAGKPSDRTESLVRTARRLGIQDALYWPGEVPFADLPLLYNGAAVLVYPSLYEGFGLPPLEAMACGTPVIAGDHSSLPEVMGRAGLLVDMERVEDLIFAMELVLTSHTTAAAMGKRGIKQAVRFSWKKSAEKTWKVFEKIKKFADR